MVWDVCCIICGGPINIYNQELKNKPYLSWLKYLYGLGHYGKIYKFNGKDYNDHGYIGSFAISPIEWYSTIENPTEHGIICHQVCYNLLRKHLNFNLKFAHVCRQLRDFSSILKRKYPIIEKYSFDQEFNLDQCIKDGKGWLLLNPYKNKKNRDRILKMWRPLAKRFNKMKIRPSPCESATNFKSGKKLKGNNKKYWIVKKGKWYPY